MNDSEDQVRHLFTNQVVSNSVFLTTGGDLMDCQLTDD